MSAMWTQVPGVNKEQYGYNADDRESASVAHIYGQNLAAAESMTAAAAPWAGDAYFTALAFMGQRPPSPNAAPYLIEKPYYGDTDLKNPLLSPVVSPGILAKFPPTLILTATRAAELSSAVHNHAELVKAGAEAELHVWDGMWHGFFLDPDLPESQEAYDVIVKFFAQHLGRAGP